MQSNQPQWSIGEVQLAYRPEKKSMLGSISSSRDAVKYFTPLFEDCMDHYERFMILHLSRSNRIIGHSTISQGGVSGTVVDPKIVFQHLLKTNAAAFIMCHNHPSGTTNESQADRDITRKIREGGKILDIVCLDHVILANDGFLNDYNSAADNDWL